MSKQSWQLFERRQPRAHLVVVVMDEAEGAWPKHAQLVLERLVRRHEPSDAYATTIVRESGRPEIFIAFQEERDARTLGDALQAGAPEGVPRDGVHLTGGRAGRRSDRRHGRCSARAPGTAEGPSANRPKVGRHSQGSARRPIARIE